MFNIGMGDLFLIVLLALVVVGPERLPGIMRQIGKYAYQLRAIVNELTDQFADELRPLQEIQQLAEELNPVTQVKKVAMSVAEPLQDVSGDAKPELVKPPATADTPENTPEDTSASDNTP
jgi:sec-independent protein translocase protein TatB